MNIESYVKPIDHDLWHVISIGDFQPIKTNFENQNEFFKRKFCKNIEEKIMIYKALPRVEYERIFICQTKNDIWENLLNVHQGNSQAKDNHIDLENTHEQFVTFEDESLDWHSDKLNTNATSSSVFIEGSAVKDYMNNLRRELIEESWSDTDEEDNMHFECEICQKDETSSEVHSKIEHFCMTNLF